MAFLISTTTLFLAAVVALTGYTIVPSVIAWYRLRHIPGPKIAAWTNLWLINKLWRGNSFNDMSNVCTQYGNMVRIAPNYVICGDPNEVRRLWSVRSPFERGDWFKPRAWFKSGRKENLPDEASSQPAYNHHGALRSKVYAGYNGKGVDGVHDAIDEGIERFAQLIDEKYISTATEYRPVDLGRKIQFMTLDIISKIAFGETLGYLDNDDDIYSYIRMSHSLNPVIPVLALVPWLLTIAQSKFLRALLPVKDETIGLRPIRGFVQNVVDKRFGPKAIDQPDMLGSFVRNGLTHEDAEAEAMVQISAGSETTATVIRTTLLHAASSPPLYRRLQKEVDDAIARGEMSQIATDAEARKLPLLQACIKEGLRIWPPASGLNPRIAPVDAVVCGVHIPAGTNVAWSSKHVMHDKAVFGADGDVYNPDRWLNASPEQLQAMESALDLTFGQGKGMCLGKTIATMELNKALCEIFRRYDFSLLNTQRPIRNDFYVFTAQSELMMRVERRDKSAAKQ